MYVCVEGGEREFDSINQPEDLSEDFDWGGGVGVKVMECFSAERL